MPGETIRILSDVHYGDRASRVHRLAQLRPLLDGADHLVLNGDTLDTRPGPAPAHTAACRVEVMEFFPREVAAVTFLTGNHDADFSPQHSSDLAAGRVFVLHGDILFDDIVPWGRDARVIAVQIAAELRALPATARESLETRFAVWRRVAASIPQRHQSERNSLKHAWHFAADTVWPPLRFLHILRAWRHEPILAAQLARRHRPAAGFIVIGHTHRPGIWHTPAGVIVINTGSFGPLLGGWAVDVTRDRITARQIQRTAGEFRLGRVAAEFPLASQ